MKSPLTRRELLWAAVSGTGVALSSRVAVAVAPISAGGGTMAPFRPPGAPAAGLPPVPRIPPWAFDVDGNGSINGDDRRIIEANLGTSRGFDLIPRQGYEFRADLHGRGRVTAADLSAFDDQAMPGPTPARPVVMCWHYPWYHLERRVRELPTASYLGGDYSSDDPVVEDRFNALKNEFGITADLLSWIDEPPGEFDSPLNNLEKGYFAAPSAGTRRFGWLYETSINLRSNRPMSLAPGTGRPLRLVQHFRRMARRMIDQQTGALASNVLRLDGRPVIYMFASHLLGQGVLSMFDVVVALSAARTAFIEEAGIAPYLIGDEALFQADEGLESGRRLRAAFFDAVGRYHHYERDLVTAFAADGPVHLGGDYLQRVVANERRTMEVFAGLRNRYTGAPLLIIPSSAAGFAKDGAPTLRASRGDYERLLRAMLSLTADHIAGIYAGESVLSPPVIVGSWNEEFEGHALFPARANKAMVGGGLGGFEWLLAIKEVYGSNPRERAG